MKKSSSARRFQFGIVMLSALSVLSACSTNAIDSGSAKDNGEGAVNDSGKEIVELTYWRTDFEPDAGTTKALIKSFEEKYPNIKINMELIPTGEYETKIRTALAGGEPPDIMALDGPNLYSYADQGVLLELDRYLEESGHKEDIAKPVLDSLTYKGKIYAAPHNDSSLAMFYNKKMFEAAGIPLPSKDPDEAWTWEQVLEAAKKLNNPEAGVYGWNPTPWGFAGHEGAPYSEMTFIWQAGGDILSPDATTAKGYLDSAESKKALEFWRTLYNEHNVAPKELPQDAFANGNVAIHIDGAWGIGYLSANFPDFKLDEDYGVAPLWKDAKQVTPNGSWNMSITAKTEHPEEAWTFVNWVTGVEGAKVWYEQTTNLPARLSTAEAFPELNEYPMNIFVEQSAKYAKPRPSTPAYPTVSEAIRELFEDVGLGNRNVDEAINEAVNKIEQGIARYK